MALYVLRDLCSCCSPLDFMLAMYSVKPITELHPDLHGLKAWDQKFISDLPDNSTLFNRFSSIESGMLLAHI